MRAEHDDAEARIAVCLDAADLHGAATEAIRAYGPSVMQYLQSVVGKDEVAYEVFSEFSESLWTALPRFRREASFRTWAYKLAWATAQDWKRRAARSRVRRLETSEISKIVAEVRSTTPVHERPEAADRWQAIRAVLSEEDRSLLILRLDRRLSWREVAQVMTSDASPPATAALRKRFERLKAKLRQLAETQGLRRAP